MMKNFVILFVVLLLGLNSCTKEIPFEKEKWLIKEDFEYPYREKMITDLLDKHNLKGFSYQQIVDLLGEPDKTMPSTVTYPIRQDYGTDIDPIYSKYLEFRLDQDSVVIDFKLKEHRME